MTTHLMTFADLFRLLPNAKAVQFEHVDMNTPIQKFNSDSREIGAGEVFIAIKGTRFDGHLYLKDVHQKNAIAVIVSSIEELPLGLPAILVKDTVQTLQQLARAWRQDLGTDLAVVTGSNGKTTVKEMIAAIFAAAVSQDQFIATQGNLNNEIGLPMTLLRLNREHRLAVIELGMNHPGETAVLADVAKPTIALINNAQREHQEFMKDVQAVAVEHSAVIEALDANGTAIFPADDMYASIWRTKAGSRKVIDFEFSADGSFHTQALARGSWAGAGLLKINFYDQDFASIEVKLSTLGHHNARNALAASAVARAFGISLNAIEKGLSSFRAVNGRMQVKDIPSDIGRGIIIDDTYNANPDSVRAAVDVLAELEGQRWLALGDMGEVGVNGPAYHREVGEYARQRGIDYLFATGELTEQSVLGFNQTQVGSAQAEHFANAQLLSDAVLEHMKTLQAKDSQQSLAILVKGSRFTKMERVVNYLLKGESACC